MKGLSGWLVGSEKGKEKYEVEDAEADKIGKVDLPNENKIKHIKSKLFIRLHPLLPLPEEILKKPKLLYSDQLPLMYNVQIKRVDEVDVDNKFENMPSAQVLNKDDLKIISWKLLGNNAASGFHKTAPNDWENEEQAQQRFTRIVEAIHKMVHKQKPDIIVLQAAQPEFIVKPLMNSLPGWIVRHTKQGLIMCYQDEYVNDKLKPITNIYKDEKDVEFDEKFMQLRQAESFVFAGQNIVINNVNTQTDTTPVNHESYYRELLTRTNKEDIAVSVVVGNTYSQFAPKSLEPQRITAGIVPMAFNEMYGAEPDQQIPDFSDGAFMRNQQGEIIQLDGVVLDYNTGHEFVDDKTGNSISPLWPHFRMMMSLDDEALKHYADLLMLEEKLNDFFQSDKKILIRPAVKDNNERGIGISLSKESQIFEYIKAMIKDGSDIQIEYQFDRGVSEKSPIIFVKQKSVNNFIELLNNFLSILKDTKKLNTVFPGNSYDSEDNESHDYDKILFRPVESDNELTIALTIYSEHPFFKFILKQNEDQSFFRITHEDEEGLISTVVIAADQLKPFIDLIADTIEQYNKAYEFTEILEQRIKDIQSSKYNPILWSGADKIQSLNRLCGMINENWSKQSLSDIVNDWKTKIAPYYQKCNDLSRAPINGTVIERPRNIFLNNPFYTLLFGNANPEIVTTKETIKRVALQPTHSEN